MSSLLKLLGLDPESKSLRRAKALAAADLKFLRDLVELRKSQNLTQQDVADRMGVSQATVASFERYDNDPKLSTLRRYSHAVEGLVAHLVVKDEGQLAEGKDWFKVTIHVASQTTSAPKQLDYAVPASRGSLALAA